MVTMIELDDVNQSALYYYYYYYWFNLDSDQLLSHAWMTATLIGMSSLLPDHDLVTIIMVQK